MRVIREMIKIISIDLCFAILAMIGFNVLKDINFAAGVTVEILSIVGVILQIVRMVAWIFKETEHE